jgi:hypothetical protein
MKDEGDGELTMTGDELKQVFRAWGLNAAQGAKVLCLGTSDQVRLRARMARILSDMPFLQSIPAGFCCIPGYFQPAVRVIPGHRAHLSCPSQQLAPHQVQIRQRKQCGELGVFLASPR